MERWSNASPRLVRRSSEWHSADCSSNKTRVTDLCHGTRITRIFVTGRGSRGSLSRDADHADLCHGTRITRIFVTGRGSRGSFHGTRIPRISWRDADPADLWRDAAVRGLASSPLGSPNESSTKTNEIRVIRVPDQIGDPPPGFFGGVTGTVAPGSVGCSGCGNAGTVGVWGVEPLGAMPTGSRGGCWMPGRSTGVTPPVPPLRPSRNGRKSASVTSSTRTICGVSVRMMSVWSDSFLLRANRRPMSGMSTQSWHASEHRALLVADEAGEHIGLAILQPDGRGNLPRGQMWEGRPSRLIPSRRCCSTRSSTPTTLRRHGACAA